MSFELPEFSSSHGMREIQLGFKVFYLKNGKTYQINFRLHLHSQRTESHIHPAKKIGTHYFSRWFTNQMTKSISDFSSQFTEQKRDFSLGLWFWWPKWPKWIFLVSLFSMTKDNQRAKVNFLGVSIFNDQRQPKWKKLIF